MRFKLDENIDQRLKLFFAKNDYIVSKISDEKLNGASDEVVVNVCQAISMCL